MLRSLLLNHQITCQYNDPSVCLVVTICFNASNMGKHDRYPYIPRIVAFGQCVVMKTIDNGGMEYSRELGGHGIKGCA